MTNLQISKLFEFVFVCSCLSVWTVSVRSIEHIHFMFGLRRVKSVIYAILSNTIILITTVVCSNLAPLISFHVELLDRWERSL